MKKLIFVLLICIGVATITGCSEKNIQKDGDVIEKKTEEREDAIKFRLPKEAQAYKVTDSFAQTGDADYEEKIKEYQNVLDLSGVESAIGKVILEQNNLKISFLGFNTDSRVNGGEKFSYLFEVENTNDFDVKFVNRGNYVNGLLLTNVIGGGSVKANSTKEIFAGDMFYEDCARTNVNNITSIVGKFEIYDDELTSFEVYEDPSLALYMGDLNIAGEMMEYTFDTTDKKNVIDLNDAIIQLDAFEVKYSNYGYDMYFYMKNTSDKELKITIKNFMVNDKVAATYAPSYQEWLKPNDIGYSIVSLDGKKLEETKIDKEVKSLSFDIVVDDYKTLKTIKTQKVLFEAE